jgi:hypothetical protein
MAEMEV